MTSSAEPPPIRSPYRIAVEPGQVGGDLARRDQVVRGQRVLEVRAADLGDLRAERLEQLDRLGEPGHHPRLVAVAGELADDADPQPGHVAVPRRLDHGRHRGVDRRGVHRVVPGHGLVQQGGVEHGPAERPRRVQGRRERDDPVPGVAAVGRLHADDPAHRGRLADRAAGVRAERERRLVGGDRGGRAAGGAAGHLRQVPRVVDRPEPGVLRGGAHRELVHVGLADEDRARIAQPPGDGGLIRRVPALEDLRPAGRRRPDGGEQVLDRDRHAGQRAERLARRPPAVDVARLRQRVLRGHVQERLDLAVNRGDAVQVRLVTSAAETSPAATAAASSAAVFLISSLMRLTPRPGSAGP